MNPVPPTDEPRRDRGLLLLAAILAFVVAIRWYDDSRWSARPFEKKSLSSSIDLNNAGRAELQQLPGVGPAKAEKILAARNEKGSLSGVQGIAGFGPKSASQLQSWMPKDEEPDVLSRKPVVPPAPVGRKVLPEPNSIDINSAPIEELQRLPGIGAVLAQRIVDERKKRPFTSVEDLDRVSGLGVKKIEAVRAYVKVGK